MKRIYILALLILLTAGTGWPAPLTDAQRSDVWGKFMDRASSNSESLGDILEPDGRAATNATDDWVEANFTGFNNSLPEPVKSEWSTKQKLRLFMDVIIKKWGAE